MEKFLFIVQAGVASYLAYKAIKSMMELTPAVEEVDVEEDSGSLINDVSDLKPLEDLDVVSNPENGLGSLNETDDAEFSEAVNGTPAVDVDEDSDDEWSPSDESEDDDDDNGYSEYVLPFHLSTIKEEDESEENRNGWLSGYDWAEDCDSDSE